jgi:hypothetical protein
MVAQLFEVFFGLSLGGLVLAPVVGVILLMLPRRGAAQAAATRHAHAHV